MQSRVEDILQAMIDGTESSELPKPQSRNEDLLLQVLDKMNEGGGGAVIDDTTVSTTKTWSSSKIDSTKLDANQGDANSGKVMGVDATGDVVPVEVEGGNIAVTETPVSGEDYAIDIVEGEHGSVTSVAGKTGVVTLNGDDVSYSDLVDYGDGTVGGEIADLKSQISAVDSMALGAYPADTVSGAVASFSDGADGIPVKDLVIAIEPVQSGSGDPSSDNVRPISGWTGANVTRCGKNLINAPDITLDRAGYVFRLTNLSLPKGTYTLSLSSNNTSYSFAVGGPNGDYINTTIQLPYTFTTDGVINSVRLYSNNVGTYANIQLEAGTKVTQFEPYVAPTTIPITFPTEAGTVYGGTLDVTTGVLTVTHKKIADIDKLSYTHAATIGTYYNIGGITDAMIQQYNSTPLAISNGLVAANRILANTPVNTFALNSNYHTTNALFIKNDASIAADYDAFLASIANIEIVYPLATPQTYQLTPVEVLTLLGANTIFADTGDTTVNYRADPTLYADKRSNATRSIVAGIEPTMTASKAYTVGQLLIVGDTLYKVAASIASGATLTPGTNVNATTVAEQLILLANA